MNHHLISFVTYVSFTKRNNISPTNPTPSSVAAERKTKLAKERLISLYGKIVHRAILWIFACKIERLGRKQLFAEQGIEANTKSLILTLSIRTWCSLKLINIGHFLVTKGIISSLSNITKKKSFSQFGDLEITRNDVYKGNTPWLCSV